MDRIIENNQVAISGEIVSEFSFNHQIYGENFYMVDVSVQRLSDAQDIIPVMVSDRLIDVDKSCIGSFVRISGQFRSYNKHDDGKARLILSVFAREIEFVEIPDSAHDANNIYLEGFICKNPIYRKTPLGREIADVLLAVNRPYGKSDYIPCICWGRNARYASSFEIGEKCAVWGRVQSREYSKKIDEENTVIRIAYEVSVAKMEVLGDEEEGY